MIKNYLEIFISGSRNIELLILTMKTKYFCSAVQWFWKARRSAWQSRVPDQIGTLSQVGTSSYMAYAMQELT